MANSSRLEDDLKPQARQVLSMLRAAGERGVSTGDFIRAYISRFGGRVHELRGAGFSIETSREGQGKSRYTLRAEPVGISTGAHIPASTSADSGGADPVRSMDSAVATAGPEAHGPGGGALFDIEAFTTRRRYADAEEAAA